MQKKITVQIPAPFAITILSDIDGLHVTTTPDGVPLESMLDALGHATRLVENALREAQSPAETEEVSIPIEADGQ